MCEVKFWSKLEDQSDDKVHADSSSTSYFEVQSSKSVHVRMNGHQRIFESLQSDQPSWKLCYWLLLTRSKEYHINRARKVLVCREEKMRCSGASLGLQRLRSTDPARHT